MSAATLVAVTTDDISDPARSLLPDAVMWHAELSADGLLRVRIDRQDKSVNALSRGMLEELDLLLAEVRRVPEVRGVMFFSGKPGNFIVGADVAEMKSIGGGSVAAELSQFGQRVFQSLESLPVPTVALISGSCLGGGLEFVMSCRYRIADDHAKTLLGLPEVKLGLIPGWGGTVRLPKLVGLLEALPMILTGRMVSGRQSRTKGLVHDMVPIEALPFVGESLLKTVIKFGTARSLFKRPGRSLMSRLTESFPPLRNYAFRRAELETRKQTLGQYPAPLAAIEVLRAGFRQAPSIGFASESATIGRLADHPVTRECLRLFFLQEDAKKLTGAEYETASPLRSSGSLKNAAVLGAGAMGAGIALLMAQKGIWTRLKDISEEVVAKGLATARKLVQADLERRRIAPLQASDTFDHLRPTTGYAGMKNADIVIEAVVERLSIKQQVFQELAQATSPKTVLATNTSSLLVRDVAAGVPNPERVVGLHFFNPPHQMPLVEIVRTELSSREAIATAFALTQRLGKTAVIVGDCPGFLVNRLLAPYMNEAGWLLLEVTDPLEIDRAAVAFGMPMGPLELTDLVGLDVAQHVATNMHAAYGERMLPAPLWDALKELATSDPKSAETLLVGKGRSKRLNPAVRNAIEKVRRSGSFSSLGSSPSRDDITQRLIYPIVNEAARCLDERIVSKSDDVDLAMVFGTGFAPFRGGPMRFAETIGVNKIVDALDKFSNGRPRLAPSDALRKRC
ncbi:MAG: 3-hydroxyacyl-CoA dehydrogenase NAD-binding domain-containing protein [Planctomycetia bacterium]|nr:3-hydroxyacyl-CoA dehydrogenase NAD-binding domain-containing protein [Planctomycetia bacterium]